MKNKNEFITNEELEEQTEDIKEKEISENIDIEKSADELVSEKNGIKQTRVYKFIRRKIKRNKVYKYTRRKIKRTFLYKKVYLSIKKIHRVVNAPSFFPEYERKTKLTRYIENYKWLFRFGRYNPSYNLFGLDVKGLRNYDDYVDVKYIKKDRMKEHHQNHPLSKHRKENMTIRYSLLADNKHVFYSYIESMNKDLVPATYFVVQGEKVLKPLDLDNKITTSDCLNKLKNGKYICKATIGAFGDNIYVIEKKSSGIVINKGNVSYEEFMESISGEPYLIQEFIKQHPKINKLNPNSVNTLRIISTRWNEETHILASMIRLGVDNQIVDNASNGGTFVGINIDKGTLMEYGYYYDKPREKCHPNTKTVYKDFQIPYWDEAIKIIKKLHPIIFGISTIGWDIAITEKGPVIVEINWNYSVKGIQIASGGFWKKWEELKTK